MDNETEYIKALINRAQEFAGDEEYKEEHQEPKKPKAKRQYSDETKAKMVERLRVAREKSLETRKLKAGIRDGIKQETKEQEKSKLMELSAKYTKPVQSAPSTKQVEIPKQSEPKQVQQTVQPTQPSRPKYFLPTMSHAKKWNTFNNPL